MRNLAKLALVTLGFATIQGQFTSIYDGLWGDWQSETYAPKGYLACGANLRVEGN